MLEVALAVLKHRLLGHVNLLPGRYASSTASSGGTALKHMRHDDSAEVVTSTAHGKLAIVRMQSKDRERIEVVTGDLVGKIGTVVVD